jgi:hypothetical protein
MHAIFRRSEKRRTEALMLLPEAPASPRRLWQTGLYFACLVLFLVFSDWFNTNEVTITMNDGTVLEANVRYSRRGSVDIREYDAAGRLATEVRRLEKAEIRQIEPKPGFVMAVHGVKWYLAGAMGLAVLVMLRRWFSRDEVKDWLRATWDFGLMIVPLLFGGVFVTGFIGALIPEKAVAGLVGGNSLSANFLSAFIGMLWYFATLTEIPIVEMLTRLGMGKGPALALLLAGPAQSVPSILVLYKVIGVRKTFMFCFLTVVMSTLVGYAFGVLAR